ncbi:ubiquitin carboxyl-terminal hydrolase-domain-containing protein [Crassisporium funariophilum]|nr:ubiquitin carboxyl-terminal hydrolase-domain-containing protein [Crassisporium funariophilum]
MTANSYKPITPINSTAVNGFAQPVTALSFDPVSDILWSGSNCGTVTAYFGVRGARGVSFRVGSNLGVTKVVAGDNHVRALGAVSEGLGSWSKGGMNKCSPTEIITFSNTSHTSHFLAASLCNLEMVMLSSMTGAVIRQVPTTSVLTHLELSHSVLLSGSSDGYLRVHDPRTGMGRVGASENLVKAHSSSIEGLQTAGNFVFTIGMGERQATMQSRPFPDPLVKVYDLRTMRPLPPVPFSAGPAFIRTFPKRPSSLVVVSNQGLVNIVDVSNPSASSEFYQLDLTSSYITSASISPSAAYMAFGDAEGTIHLMSQAEDSVPFNGFEGQPVPWADTPAPLPDIEWTQSTPLNTIGVPYFDSQLLSAWPSQLSSKTVHYPPPPRIPPQILISMKTNENVTYATLPKELRGRRNMTNTAAPRGNGRFRSGKSTTTEPEPDSATFENNVDQIPRIYRRVEIEYSKFGVEDFDFGFYNTTDFSGLETHILNSYVNSVVQVMHYISPIRRLAKAHISINCPREHCLFCELGFVSRMLEDAHGTNCQASNFCKTVGVLAQASNAIELIDYGRQAVEVDYVQKIQTFHRFLIDHLSSEGNSFPHNPLLLSSESWSHRPAPSPITQLLGVDGKNVTTCSNCKSVREKDNMTHVVDLIYPRKPAASEQQPSIDFSTILQSSLFHKLTHKAICQNCKQFCTFTTCRSASSQNMPAFLAVNASVYDDEDFSFWQDARGQTFLQAQMYLHGQNKGIYDTEDTLYEIRALVVKITGKKGESHLVAIIKVPEAEAQGMSSPWFLFNDFVVKNISQEEALGFRDNWKACANSSSEDHYHLNKAISLDLQKTLDFSGLTFELDSTILSRDTSISLNRDYNLVKHEFLHPDELPKPGTLVAIDAEFVSMQQEETEFRSDGTKKVLRPARLSLARVSVLRGNGPRQGVPFIDDHIHTSEIIVDYLTEFSGIKFGDLDPVISRYTLTPLKLVYKKLRLLVDCGCIFIGHGLSKDFRIINIYVPPEQVIDTVDLYFIRARQRRLSLRFLSWFILGEHIQTDTHDSIEDARSALRLYNAYQEFEEDGVFDQKLEEVYKEGRQFNFKPPSLPNPFTNTGGSSSPKPVVLFTQSNVHNNTIFGHRYP